MGVDELISPEELASVEIQQPWTNLPLAIVMSLKQESLPYWDQTQRRCSIY